MPKAAKEPMTKGTKKASAGKHTRSVEASQKRDLVRLIVVIEELLRCALEESSGPYQFTPAQHSAAYCFLYASASGFGEHFSLEASP